MSWLLLGLFFFVSIGAVLVRSLVRRWQQEGQAQTESDQAPGAFQSNHNRGGDSRSACENQEAGFVEKSPPDDFRRPLDFNLPDEGADVRTLTRTTWGVKTGWWVTIIYLSSFRRAITICRGALALHVVQVNVYGGCGGVRSAQGSVLGETVAA
ncbi:unnamed protein product [Linum trigynum]|uniref:Uncharacterized protein n=1 Tax=Linum trigynum TaxID=586398 RepID=A0AAV2FAU0_9ROSI